MKQRQEPIAIVGVAALFPGSVDVTGFWRDILQGRDLLTDVPPTHWLIEDYYDPDPSKPDKTYARRGAFLSDVDFDPVQWGIPPAIVPQTDTTQLLALIVAQKVLDDACDGQFSKIDRSRVSCILGVTSGQELMGSMVSRLQRPVWVKALREAGLPESKVQQICDRIANSYTRWEEASFPGLLGNVVAGRIANRLDLGGTNCVTDAACASTFSALSMAVNELTVGQSDLVIAGGCDTMNDIFMYMCFSKTPALSPTGDCRPFSDAADGTMLGEGLGMVALKRLADAERDGDRIYAVIRGVGSSSDGRAKSVYAPLPSGQAQAIRRAYEIAGWSAASVELVEAHGTGTKAGDAAEFEGLRTVFEESGREDRQWCALGSVKSQIGHTKSAAGAAGLIKAVLALHHKILPPTIKIDAPNPRLEIERSPFYLCTEARPWVRKGDHPRRAGVSSFGFGGSNFHVAVEEYTGPAAPAWRARTCETELVLLGAADGGALARAARAMASEVEAAHADGRHGMLRHLARTTQEGFAPTGAARLAVVASDEVDLVAKLRRAADAVEREAGAITDPSGVYFEQGAHEGRLAFLFPGQGSQYLGMGKGLAMTFDEARGVWDRAATLRWSDETGAATTLDEIVFPRPTFDAARKSQQRERLTRTEWAQPAIGAASLATLRLLERVGLLPSAVAGHSFGEVVALHAAGAIAELDVLRIARVRGERMAEAARSCAGAMSAVVASASNVEAVLAGSDLPVVIANHNAPDQVVLSGPTQAVQAAEERLRAAGMACRRLEVATAFHSPVVAAAVEPFREWLRDVPVQAPRIAVHANATAGLYPPDPDGVRAMLGNQLAQPVRFVEIVEAMHAAGVRTFVEVGPGSVLTGLVSRILAGRPHRAIATDRKGSDATTSLHHALGRLAVAGLPLSLGALWSAYAPVVDPRTSPKPRMAMKINGSNYGKPYPPPGGAAALPKPNPEPAPEHAEVRKVPVAEDVERVVQEAAQGPVVTAAQRAQGGAPVLEEPRSPWSESVQAGWIEAYREAQQQTAQAHAAFQRAMADAHAAFLKSAETSFAALAAMLQGPAAALAPSAPNADALPRDEGPLGLARAPMAAAPMPTPAAPVEMPTPAAPMPTPAAPMPTPAARVENPTAARLAPTSSASAAHSGAIPTPTPGAGSSAPTAAPRAATPVDLVPAMLDVVAQKTGYPADMIALDMALEADLGIDSIKRVEILAAVRDRFPGLPELDPARLGALRTLREVVDHLAQALPAATPTSRTAPATSRAPAASSAPATSRAAATSPAPAAPTRWITRAVPAPPSGLVGPGLLGAKRLVLTDDETGVAPALAAALAARERPAEVVRDIPTDADAVIFLGGLRDVATVDDQIAVDREAFRAAKACAARGVRAFVTVQDTGGDFGLGGSPRAWLAGLSALAKTLAQEWPETSVRAIDVARGARSCAEVAEALAEELVRGGPEVEVGLREDGSRVTLVCEPVALEPSTPLLGPSDVVLASGGARGVTAASLVALARASRCRFVLLGRTPLENEPEAARGVQGEAALKRALLEDARTRGESIAPAELGKRVERILAAREVRRTLDAIRDAGAQARYFALDVQDASALGPTLDEVRRSWGPVTAIVHGAGVLADRLLADKTPEQFDRVFDTKVQGLRALLAATENDPLRAIVLFSSVAARAGNPGQCDYAMANEVLNKVACALRARRGVRVRALGWGPWRGGMVSPALEARFAALGVPLIAIEDGARMFVEELGRDAGEDVEVVLGGEPGPAALAGPSHASAKRTFEVVIDERSHPFVASHVVKGTAVLPAVLVIELFARAARLRRPDLVISAVRDLRVLRGVRLLRYGRGGDRFVVESTLVSNGSSAAFEMALVGEAGATHYTANVEMRRRLDGPSDMAAPMPALGALRPWSDVVYGDVLFHGPMFHAIAEVEGESERGIAGALVGMRELGWSEQHAWATDPALLDGGLQLAVLWTKHALGGASLPTSIGAYVPLRAEPRGPCRAVAVGAAKNRDQAVLDVVFVDGSGRPVARLESVEVSVLPGSREEIAARSRADA